MGKWSEETRETVEMAKLILQDLEEGFLQGDLRPIALRSYLVAEAYLAGIEPETSEE